MTNTLSQTADMGMKFKKAISALEKRLRPLEDSESTIIGLLQGTAEFYGADRAFVIEVDWEAGIGVNTYEWCADDIRDRRAGLHYLEAKDFPTWLDSFKGSESVAIHDLITFAQSHPTEYEFLKCHGVSSLLVAPFIKRISQGYIGVDNPTQYIDDPSFLFLISYAIVLELNEIKLEQAVAVATRQLSRISKQSSDGIVIKALGELEITGPKGILTSEDLKADQCYALLVYLLLNHGRTPALDRLYEIIRPYEAMDNPYRVVKNIVYRTRKLLQVVGLENLIVAKSGSYCINPELKLYMDFERFEKKCIGIKAESNKEKQEELYHCALSLYRGNLFPRIGHELWLMQRALYYQSLYLQMVKEHIRQKMEEKEYFLVQKAVIEGFRADPHDSELNLYYIKSLYLQGNTVMAQSYLSKARENLCEEQLRELSTYLKI